MKILKKNQLTILVIALMLITAGYLNYTAKEEAVTTNGNIVSNEEVASIGDATLVNSGELLEENDKQTIANAIETSISNNENDTTVQTNNETDDYFATSKLEREKMYSQMLESYQKLLESESISQEQKAISQQEINNINQTKNAIMIAENLITTKGFEKCIIFVNSESVSIVVKADKLEPEQISQIQNIISRELKASIENIHISNK